MQLNCQTLRTDVRTSNALAVGWLWAGIMRAVESVVTVTGEREDNGSALTNWPTERDSVGPMSLVEAASGTAQELGS